MAALAMLEVEAEVITRKAIELAKGGDMMAVKLVLDRLLPRGRVVLLDMPLRPWPTSARRATRPALRWPGAALGSTKHRIAALRQERSR